MPENLLKVLHAMKEAQLTRQVVLPLMRALFPDARIEETHGSIEEGRDLVCFGTHPILNRPHVLAVQIKNHKISYGATAGPYSVSSLKNQVEHARRIGVVRENGDLVQPDEVWVISGHPFSAGHRKVAQQFLQDISLLLGKFVDGSELVALLRKRCPDLVQELESIADSRLAQAIAWLSQHHESKAFGLRLERTLEDFHVKSRVFPTGANSSALFAGELSFKPLSFAVNSEIPFREVGRFKGRGQGVVQSDVAGSRVLKSIEALVRQYCVPVEWDAAIEDDLLSLARAGRGSTGTPDPVAEKSLPVPVERSYDVRFDVWLDAHRAKLMKAIRSLPAKLDSGTCSRVKGVVGQVRDVEEALGKLLPLCIELECANQKGSDAVADSPHLQIADERLLLKVAPSLLVQGAPGAGKTTFSRRLAVALLRDGAKVVFVPCATVKPELKRWELSEIVARYAAPGTPRGWGLRNAVVIIDGLDEAPFDLSDVVLAGAREARCGLVATARAAFPTRLREEFATIEISGFTADDRNAFFGKWFGSDAKRLLVAEQLVSAHSDIELHTRLPLMATLVAALVENGFSPTTRAEIYAQRLDLLLERWEAVKGLQRSTVARKSQLRFLKHLAFLVHGRKNRSARFGWEELRAAFARGLGKFGDSLDPDEFVRKLVVISGVLQSDGKEFTFGHLSFQEHLAGGYLVDHGYIDDIGELLGDDWWAEVLKFYAGISQDITELIDWCERRGTTRVHQEQLRALVAHAPHTGSVAVQILEAT